MTSFSLDYEAAAITFNIGAMYSQLGEQEGTNSADGLKRACNYFLLAAGAFEYIQTKYLDKLVLPVGTDLSDTILGALSKLMLAQAQECFVIKATLERNVKDSTLAKLSASTASLFDAAKILSIKSPILADFVDLLAGKIALYQATAHFHKSAEFLATMQYGREIVKLQEADEVIGEAKGLMKRLSSDILLPINLIASQISKALERAIKDNQIIYHDPLL